MNIRLLLCLRLLLQCLFFLLSTKEATVMTIEGAPMATMIEEEERWQRKQRNGARYTQAAVERAAERWQQNVQMKQWKQSFAFTKAMKVMCEAKVEAGKGNRNI